MTEHIEGLELAFGDGKEWCVSDNFGRQKCDHKLHPYIIADVGGRYGCKVVYGQHSGGGAYFIGHEEVNEANANLIAAAPALLAAAEAALQWNGEISNWATGGMWVCVVCGAESETEPPFTHDEDCFIPQLRAAISQARGEA